MICPLPNCCQRAEDKVGKQRTENRKEKTEMLQTASRTTAIFPNRVVAAFCGYPF